MGDKLRVSECGQLWVIEMVVSMEKILLYIFLKGLSELPDRNQMYIL